MNDATNHSAHHQEDNHRTPIQDPQNLAQIQHVKTKDRIKNNWIRHLAAHTVSWTPDDERVTLETCRVLPSNKVHEKLHLVGYLHNQWITYQNTLLCGVVFTAAEKLSVSFISLLPRLILLALPRRQVLQNARAVFIVALCILRVRHLTEENIQTHFVTSLKIQSLKRIHRLFQHRNTTHTAGSYVRNAM